MRDLFDDLVQDGEAAIERLKANRFQENVELEFKTKAKPTDGTLSKEDRKKLGIALSALSNSMGGILIWGVVAAKNEDGVDCAIELQPISQLERFKSEVERAISQAIMPRHEGIRVLPISRSTERDSGYLAVRVERSERRPHRCEFGEKQYFKRIGDSSIAMEHYDIEDAFNRIVVPSLEADHVLSNGGQKNTPTGLHAIVRITIFLRNISQVSARFPYFAIEAKSESVIAEPTEHRGFRQQTGRFFGGADDVIHPELAIKALTLTREFRIRDGHLARGTLEPPMVIEYRCGCLHSRPRVGTCRITESAVAAALNIPIL